MKEKKIKVSSINMTTDVQVIFCNTSLVAKVAKANIIAEQIKNTMLGCGAIEPHMIPTTEENAEDEMRQATDKNENLIWNYNDMYTQKELIKDLNETIFPILNELMTALEE